MKKRFINTMSYLDKINEVIKIIPNSLIDFSLERTPARIPTQVSSNFITNKQQGDWAESIIFNAVNKTSKNYAAVKYGKSDDIIAGDKHFPVFFQKFQEELDTIGKRPDLLIFSREDFIEKYGFDISDLPHDQISQYIKKAKAGIEIRSSAFLIDKYKQEMQIRFNANQKKVFEIKDIILKNYYDLLKHDNRKRYISILENINTDTLHAIQFKVPGWNADERLSKLNDLLKNIKVALKDIQKRNFLSITPKVEDLKVVYKWIETFNVPHFYFQVFFDKIYGLSFEDIMKIISNPDNEGSIYSIEKDTKNQNKTTIKINSQIGTLLADKVDEPFHKSVRKEMARGRLLFYVTFEGGEAYLDIDNLVQLLKLNKDNF